MGRLEEGGSEGGNKEKQVSDLKSWKRKEGKEGCREDGWRRRLDSCSASSSLHPTSPELNSDLQILLKRRRYVCISPPD